LIVEDAGVLPDRRRRPRLPRATAVVQSNGAQNTLGKILGNCRDGSSAGRRSHGSRGV